jgi:hypothetical protein
MPTTSTLLNSHNPNYHEDDHSLERGWSSLSCGEKKRGHRLLHLCVLTICIHTHTQVPSLFALLLAAWFALLYWLL